jgi:hypothetical protein
MAGPFASTTLGLSINHESFIDIRREESSEIFRIGKSRPQSGKPARTKPAHNKHAFGNRGKFIASLIIGELSEKPLFIAEAAIPPQNA